MRIYDWLILIMIGVLAGGAYFSGQAPEIGTWPPPGAGAGDGVTAPAVPYVLGLAGVFIAGFVLYLLAFRGSASSLRRHGATAFLLFLTGRGIELGAARALFTGWSDPNDLANREQLFAMAEQFSRSIAFIGGLIFLALVLLAIIRRVTSRQKA